MKIKKDDIVLVNTGEYKGKKGKVLQILPKQDKVVVEGVNLRTHFVKASSSTAEGGLIKRESPIHISNVILASASKTSAAKNSSTKKKSKSTVSAAKTSPAAKKKSTTKKTSKTKTKPKAK